MCGLVVIVGRRGQPVPLEGLRRGAEALAHRGPDDSGECVVGNVGLGFRRLSIVDLSPGGHQPMTSPDGLFTLVFNGEIYNYVELRKELIGLGHVFRSTSDTEVLLAAFQQWGMNCVHRFNGMWAFVIVDHRAGTLFGARDRLGEKPLYVWQNASWLVFASETRAIGATGLCALQPDLHRLADSLRWDRKDHGYGTCLVGIRQIAAGHTFSVDSQGQLSDQPYWSLPQEQRGSDLQRDSAWIEQLGALVTDAVRLRLRSDVPIGFTLSGGIDSSLLICEASRLNAQGAAPLAFSYQDSQFDERELIADTVAQTGARLVDITEHDIDVAALLPQTVRANGEPVHSLMALANNLLFALAKQHGVKVLLGGQGADEVFAGYSNFQWHHWHSMFQDRRWAALLDDVRRYSALHGRATMPVLAATLKYSLRIGLSGSLLYRRLRALRVPDRSADYHAIFAPAFLRMSTAPDLTPAAFRLAAAQRNALTDWPLPMYLRLEDHLSMAHSVEARLPFMDYRLVELAMRMPDSLKFSGGINKIALRRVAQGRVPPSVTARIKKLGFPVSGGLRIARQLHRLCTDLTATREFRERGIYDRSAVTRLLERDPCEADVDTLFHLAQTELWLADLGPAGAVH